MATQASLPSRLHDTAYVSRELEATRRFYEDVLGFPLVATWCESDELFGPKMPPSPFHHIALNVSKEAQAEIERRLKAAGYREPDSFVLEHGYCRSVYVTDPNGMIVEFTLDHPDAEKINARRRLDAHSELKRWLAGDHASNNMFR
jgi:catechol-2,3-dioxygenase